MRRAMWGGQHTNNNDGVGGYSTSSRSGVGRGGTGLIEAVIGTVAIFASGTTAFLSPPAPPPYVGSNIRGSLCKAPFSPRARPTPATCVYAGKVLTDQELECSSFRDIVIIGDQLNQLVMLSAEDGEHGATTTKKVSAKEILEGRHVAIYFADTKTEEELDRERQKIQETNSNAPDFTRSSHFIQQAHQKAAEAGQKLEVVYVPVKGTSPERLKETPLFVTDEITRFNLMRKAGARCTLPMVLVEDDKGDLVTRDGFTNMLMFPDDFPWKNKSIKQLLSPELFKLVGDDNLVDRATALEGKTLGVYLDASWCEKCKEFTPVLKAVYDKVRAEGKPFEIVSVMRAPRSKEEFIKYFGRMKGSWCIDITDMEQAVKGTNLDLGAPGLRDHYAGVRGTNPDSNPAGLLGTAPTSTLLLFDENENLITELGRERITNDPEGAKFPWLPMPWPELPDDILATSCTTSFLVFMEDLDENEQARIREVVKRVAESRIKSAEEEGRVARPASFFTISTKTRQSQNLRKKTGLDKLDEPVPPMARVALLDSEGGRAGVKRDDELTEESLAAFVAAWEGGEILLPCLQNFMWDLSALQ